MGSNRANPQTPIRSITDAYLYREKERGHKTEKIRVNLPSNYSIHWFLEFPRIFSKIAHSMLSPIMWCGTDMKWTCDHLHIVHFVWARYCSSFIFVEFLLTTLTVFYFLLINFTVLFKIFCHLHIFDDSLNLFH